MRDNVHASPVSTLPDSECKDLIFLQVTQRGIYQNICLSFGFPLGKESHCSGNLIKKKQGPRFYVAGFKYGVDFQAVFSVTSRGIGTRIKKRD